jgi:hypothetical protein
MSYVLILVSVVLLLTRHSAVGANRVSGIITRDAIPLVAANVMSHIKFSQHRYNCIEQRNMPALVEALHNNTSLLSLDLSGATLFCP